MLSESGYDNAASGENFTSQDAAGDRDDDEPDDCREGA